MTGREGATEEGPGTVSGGFTGQSGSSTRMLRVGLALLFLLALVPVLALAGSDAIGTPAAEKPSAVRTILEGIARHGTGWEIATPALLLTSRVALDAIDHKQGAPSATKILANPRLWTGTIGSVLGARLMAAVAGSIGGPLILRSVVAASGSFLGWEAGSGFADTDWLQLAAQITTAGVTELALATALGAAGLSVGSWVTTAAGIGAAILVGIAIDKFRKTPLDPALEPLAPRVHYQPSASVSPPPPPVYPGAASASATAKRLDLVDLHEIWQTSLARFQANPTAKTLKDLQEADQAYQAERRRVATQR